MHVRTSMMLVALMSCLFCISAADITLVKHARRVKAPQTSEYVVREGDTLRKILMGVYHAKEQDLPYLYRQFKLQNPTITSLDTIHAGMKVKIPMVGSVLAAAEEKKSPAGLEVKEVSPDEYVIKQGEHLAKILKDIYGIPDDVLYRQYIDLIQQLNPEITDPDRILAGQKLKLPGPKQVLSAVKQKQTEVSPPAAATSAGVEQPREEAASAALAKAGVPVKNGEEGLPSAQSQQTMGTPSMDRGTSAPGKARDVREVKRSVLPALKSMGGIQRDSGTYFMPISGGTSLSIDTSEIPVMELDTGRKIIFDVNGTITAEMKEFIEKAFPSFTVISGSPGDLEGLMDKVLSVSGYFSINKNPSPLLVGSEEKLRFFGKWIVYKDFSRRNVFVINLLGDDENKTPQSIRRYAGNFGIDLIEIGGRDEHAAALNAAPLEDLERSYPSLLENLHVPYKLNQEIELMKSGPIRITYKAPVLVDKVILAEVLPEKEMLVMLQKQSFEVADTRELLLEEVLDILGQDFDGPPVKIAVARGRAELEIPGIRMGNSMILLKKVDQEILKYLAASGMKLFAW